ncbi:uncharacterized protein ATNIH1004_011688 [Aspergillus tanneri]|uniref:Histone H2A/H2B/H3 domain-containing protein n=1 Tax=Aspergillus tanneri TaxID=1220188 RepID=A0A5M9M3D9_9EURO|nr:uncharacterized protein ATNIH1004_011688 [Aspergillus tanneri]KAA8641552.1 hypothetical protein ATNIH1004_011688 [Aspergillus tanneri]
MQNDASIEPAPAPDLDILPKSEREIYYYSTNPGLFIPKTAFTRLVLDTLKEVAEMSLTHLFACSTTLTCHGKRATLMVEDMRLVLEIFQEFHK